VREDSDIENNFIYCVRTGLVKLIKKVKIPKQLGRIDTVHMNVMDFGPGEVINEGPLVGLNLNYSVQVFSASATAIKISYENYLRIFKKGLPDLKLYC